MPKVPWTWVPPTEHPAGVSRAPEVVPRSSQPRWELQSLEWPQAHPYLFHEGLHSLASHPTVAMRFPSLLDNVPSLAPGVILLLAQVL